MVKIGSNDAISFIALQHICKQKVVRMERWQNDGAGRAFEAVQKMIKSSTCFVATAILVCTSAQNVFAEQYQFVYTSDQHYGITRKAFRGQENVSSDVVNAAMVDAIKALPQQKLPADNGVRAGETVSWADFIISTGDIANRMEGVAPDVPPSANACWNVFAEQYLSAPLMLRRDGSPAEVLAIPGNHDVTNAVGFYRPMTPAIDKSSLVAMYNRAFDTNKTVDTLDVENDKVYFRRDLDGMRLLLVQMWPDSANRVWLSQQFDETPTLLFTHDQPDVEAKHLRNPNGIGDINATDKFENLLADVSSTPEAKGVPRKEHAELAAFLKNSPVKAYFHGNENFNEFYVWDGPDKTLNMPIFRVDSAMKGNESSKDETRLSFQFVSLDTDTRTMTVREVLWNTNLQASSIVWGQSKTITYTK